MYQGIQQLVSPEIHSSGRKWGAEKDKRSPLKYTRPKPFMRKTTFLGLGMKLRDPGSRENHRGGVKEGTREKGGKKEGWIFLLLLQLTTSLSLGQ